MKKKICLLFFAIYLLNTSLEAQIKYPVTVSGFQVQPHLYLDDYVAAGIRNMSANIVLNDKSELAGRRVFLRFEVASDLVKIQSSDNASNSLKTLFPNDIQSVFGEDFLPWFNPRTLNVQGVYYKDSENRIRLPDGFYQFTLEVCDARSGQPISNKAVSVAHIEQYEPPVILFPNPKAVDKSEVVINPQLQTIAFRWQPASANINSENTEYFIELCEIFDGEINPKNAIDNQSVRQIFKSEALSSLSYIFTPNDYPLDVGKVYAFRVIAKDKRGREMFKNNGISETAIFYYGYPQNGKIPLLYPENNTTFAYRSFTELQWGIPDNLTNNQNIRYELKIVDITEIGMQVDLESAVAWVDYTTSETRNIQSNRYEINRHMQSAAQYAWQVKAYSGNQQIAKSEVQTFFGPPAIPYFYAGNHKINVLQTFNSDFEHLSGEGEVKITESGIIQKVRFEDININNNTGIPRLQKGNIVNKLTTFNKIEISPTVEANGNAEFLVDSFQLNPEGLFLKGKMQWVFPFPVKDQSKAILNTIYEWHNYNNFSITTSTQFETDIDLILKDIPNFIIHLNPSSEARIYEKTYTLSLNGSVETSNLKSSENKNYQFYFKELEQLFYNEVKSENTKNQISIIPQNTKIYLQPVVWTFDLNNELSAEKLINQPQWKGIYINEFNLICPENMDVLQQLKLSKEIVVKALSAEDSVLCFIDDLGMFMNYKKNFVSSDSSIFNTFPAFLSEMKLGIQNNTLKEGYLKGRMYIPVISENKTFSWTIPISSIGLQSGYIDENMQGYRFPFNINGGEQQLWITVHRAVFEQRQHLNIDIDIEWPHLGLTFSGLPNFRIWGNYDIGFVERNGTIPLNEQKQATLNDYEINIESIGCGRQANMYAFGLSASMVMGDDIAGANGPVKSNFYSIAENKLLSGTWQKSENIYQNPLLQEKGSSAITGSEIGKQTNEITEEDIYYEQINQYYDAVGNAYLQISDMVSSINIDSLNHVTSQMVSDAQQLQQDFLAELPPMFDPKTLSAKDLSILLVIIYDQLDDDQQQMVEQFKKSIDIAMQLKEETESVEKQLQEFKQYLVDVIYACYDVQKRNYMKIVREKANNIKAIANGGVNKAEEVAVKLINGLLKEPLEGLRGIAVNTAEKCPPKMQASITVNKIMDSISRELQREIAVSTHASIEKNINPQINFVFDTLIILSMDQAIDIMIKSQIDALINEQNPISSFTLIPTLLKDTLENRLQKIQSMFSLGNLTITLENVVKDAIREIQWEDIGNKAIESLLGETFTAYTDRKAEEAYNKLITDVFGEESIAGQILADIPINFNNIADNLIQGRIDKIIVFAPVMITVKSKVANFTGYANFVKDDPKWGNVWMATLQAKIKISPEFSVNATFINGNSPENDYKYWFLDIGAHNLNIPVGATGLALEGASGRVYHHMSRPPEATQQFDNKIDTEKIVYTPDSHTEYGVGLIAYFYDNAHKGDIILFDCGLEIAFADKDFSMTMNGNIYVANKIEKNQKESSLIVGTGYLQFSSSEKTFIGKFTANVNAGVICAGGEMGMLFSPDQWEVYMGKHNNPLYVSLLCAKNPQFYGWFEINQSYVDLGLKTQLDLDLTSPWIGGKKLSARAWARFMFEFGADAKVSWKPIHVNRAHVYTQLYAGVGIDYVLLGVDGSFTVAAIYLSGDLLFTSESVNLPATDTSPAIKAGTYISGKLHGEVTVLGCDFGFNMETTVKV